MQKALDFSKAFLCALVGIRTPNLLIRSEMLYPIELQMRFSVLLTDCKSNAWKPILQFFQQIIQYSPLT
jgi:hypothetical protein